MAKGSRGGQRGKREKKATTKKTNSSGANQNTSGVGYKLKEGEEAYARFSPTWHNKEGQIAIYKNAKGQFVYTGYVGDAGDLVDTKSSTYKEALRYNNVIAKFNSNGSVQVSKGGLFTRKKTFKDIDSFSKQVNETYDKKIQRERLLLDNVKKGILTYSELQASNYKDIIKKSSSADALKKISKDMTEEVKHHKERILAIEDMKLRFNVSIRNAKDNL